MCIQLIWDLILKQGTPYIHYPFFWGILALFFHIITCFYFTIKDINKNVKNKIQKDYTPDIYHILTIAIPQLIIFLSLIYIQEIIMLSYPNLQLSLPKKALSLISHISEISILLVTGDFLIYWYHRLSHINKWWRNNVHDIHHTYSTVFSWAGTYLHPLEGICAVLCQLIPHLIFKPHPLSVWIHMIIWTILLDEEHSGYNVWWSPWNILPFNIGGGAEPHDIHHYKQNVNFGFIFLIWDKLFGTYCPVQKNLNNPYIAPYKLKFR